LESMGKRGWVPISCGKWERKKNAGEDEVMGGKGERTKSGLEGGPRKCG